MSTTDKRVEMMRSLAEDNFLIEASHLLNKSHGDDAVTENEHKELFAVFKEVKDDMLPDPTSSERDHLIHILSTRHSKSI